MKKQCGKLMHYPGNKTYCADYFNEFIKKKYVAIKNTELNIEDLEKTAKLFKLEIKQKDKKDSSNHNPIEFDNNRNLENADIDTFLSKAVLIREELNNKVKDLKGKVSGLLKTYIKQNFNIYRQIIKMGPLIKTAQENNKDVQIDL